MSRTKKQAGDAAGWIAICCLAAAAFLPLYEIRPNRIASGYSVFLWDSPAALTACLAIVVCVIAAYLIGHRKAYLFLWLVAGAAALVLLAASQSFATLSPAARVSPSAGLALALVGMLMASRQAAGIVKPSRLLGFIRLFTIAMAALLIGQLGLLDSFSPLIELKSQGGRFWAELGRHVFLSVTSFALALVVGIQGAVLLSRASWFGRALGAASGLIQNVPSLALFGLLLPLMAALANAFPALRLIGISGIGAAPALVALFAYALLPIMLAGAAGLRMVESAVKDAARGMGMTKAQILFRVELPLALPAIAGGARTALVQTIGTTTVAALIGAGGMGYFVFQGVGQAAMDMVLVGLVPVVAMSLAADWAMSALQRKLTQKGTGRWH